VLDVGAGNGYYRLRALGAGAALGLGIDPTLRFVMQFRAVNRYLGAERTAVLPLADSDLAPLLARQDGLFDTVLSLGVLYHRRGPAAHLALLRRCLRPGGELLLEGLVLERPGAHQLVPPGRYARMRNVHAVPSVDMLVRWLRAAGLRRVQVADLTATSSAEQRATPWMRFQSLADCLDPEQPSRTLEGHPAPVRALLRAQR
jgi:tRNA (mo5U34)-methyltransferase